MIDRMYFVWVALGFAIPYAIGYAIAGVSGGLQAMVWGGLVRIALFQHVTWSVNSICHMFGRRTLRTRDESRNNWLLALPSLGEAWHNNHHAFPSSAVHGLDERQLDLSGYTDPPDGADRARLGRQARRCRSAPAPARR